MSVVEGEHEGRQIRITIAPATVLAGMRRARLQERGRQAGETDEDRLILRVLTYPDLMAGAVKIEVGPAGGVLSSAEPGWPDFETFLTLPDSLAGAWETAVYNANLHWLPGGGRAEDPKVPAPVSTPDSASA